MSRCFLFLVSYTLMMSMKTLVQRLFTISKTFKKPTIRPTKFTPEPGDCGIFQRFIHRSASIHPSSSPDSHFRISPFVSEKLMEKLGSFGISRDRIDLECLSPPVKVVKEVRVKDRRKLVRLTEVKLRLKEISKSSITYEEYVGICGEGGFDRDDGLELARFLDETGVVIVLGNVVFLNPEQIAKIIADLIFIPRISTKDPRIKELEEMEKQKAEIDGKAADLVRRELWWGLGFLVAQTTAFMRLTFWELSWDVMEPICYYVTSTYFMAGYVFFLTTSKEPSFEGFYDSRFIAKQKRLMKLYNFDIDKYNQLQKTLDQKTPFSCLNH